MSATTPTDTPLGGENMPLLLTVAQAAELLGMSRRSCYRAVEADALPTMKVGRRILIPTARLLTELGLPLDSLTREAGPQRQPSRADGISTGLKTTVRGSTRLPETREDG